jgi:sugar-specific transcriptional regulator TrmB
MNHNLLRQSIENLKIAYPELVEDNETWLLALESETDFNEVLTSVVRKIEDTKALVIGTKDRLEELKARIDRFDVRVFRLRELACKLMQSADLKKLELPEATLSLRAGTQQLIGDADAEIMPRQFQRVTLSLDKTAIKEAIKAGQTVPGFALSNAPPSLTIRIK